MKHRINRGFTLIEILVVIGIIALLATIVIIAINPARQFAQARNSQRQSNVNTLLNALGQNLADNKGTLKNCPTIGTPAASSSIGATSPAIDLSPTNCLGTYLAGGIPMDPSVGTVADTGYDVSYDSTTGRYMVCAPKGNESVTAVQQDFCVTR